MGRITVQKSALALFVKKHAREYRNNRDGLARLAVKQRLASNIVVAKRAVSRQFNPKTHLSKEEEEKMLMEMLGRI